ncbi:hypothetical protein FCOIX_2535 [Fusarium coicis]|nr:hypothetical protein FCOIX_2535 [Fusarium coicis]
MSTVTEDPTTTATISTSEVSSATKLTSDCIEEPTTTKYYSATEILATSVIKLSSTVIESSTWITTVTEHATTTAISARETSSTVDISSTIIESTTEITTSSQESTTTAPISTSELIPTTTESTTTSEATTTTKIEVAGPPTITNLSFDDTLEPWTVTQPNLVSLSLDTNIKHDGRSSARMNFSPAGGSTTYITQMFSSPPKRGLDIQLPRLFAGRRNIFVAAMGTQPGTINQWQEISYVCTYTQAQIDQGGLALNIGFMCNAGSEAWIDSVTFSGP